MEFCPVARKLANNQTRMEQRLSRNMIHELPGKQYHVSAMSEAWDRRERTKLFSKGEFGGGRVEHHVESTKVDNDVRRTRVYS